MTTGSVRESLLILYALRFVTQQHGTERRKTTVQAVIGRVQAEAPPGDRHWFGRVGHQIVRSTRGKHHEGFPALLPQLSGAFQQSWAHGCGVGVGGGQ